MGDSTLTLSAPEGGGGADKQLQQAPPPSPPHGAKADPRATVATHTRIIGIIHPPPHIRVIIEKTATFVAKNGPGFERRVISDNQGSANFSFLRPSDPYHAYYQHRVSETAAAPPSASAEPDATPAEVPASATADGGGAPADGAAADSKAGHSADSAPFCLAPPSPQVLVPPKAELFTVRLPEGITGEELDIIKLTSQFVARNGKNFLTSLAQRDSNNMQFHFIRPMHSMFPFLTSLTEVCPRVLKPEEGVPALIKELREGSKYMTSVLEGCLKRLECELSQEQARQQAEDGIEQEQMQMSAIDWHDFAVVEAIEFADDEHEGLPVPPTLEEFKRRKRLENLGEEEAMELAEPSREVETEMDEEEMQLVEEEIRAARFEENGGGAQVKVAGDDEAPMRIIKNKRPEEKTPAVSPITGELIPICEMGENIRISLIDPKYKKQKEMMLAGIKEKTPAPDDEISRNIVGLAHTCPDVSGTTEEEVCNSVKAEIEKKKNEQPKQVICDGRSGSIDRTGSHGLSQPQGGEEQFDASSVDGRPVPGLVPLVRPGTPLPQAPQPLPLVNGPRFIAPPASYPVPPPGPHVPSGPSQRLPHMHPPQQIPEHPLMIRVPGQMAHMPTSIPPPPGQTQFMPGPPCSFAMPPPPHMLPMVNPIRIPQPPASPLAPQPPEEQPLPPDEPEPKRQRTDDASLIPAEQSLAHHPGPDNISTSVANLDGISRNTVGLARTCPDIFGNVEEVSDAIKAEIEKKKEGQPKKVIWDGDFGSIGGTATHSLSLTQPQGVQEQFDLLSVYGRPVPGPAPLIQSGMPLPWPPQPPPLFNAPRVIALPSPYHVPPPGPHVPGIMPRMHPQQVPGQPLMIRMLSQMVHRPTGISPHPGHVQFMPGPPHPFAIPPPPHMLPMDNPIGIPQPPEPPLPPQPPEEQPPPPDEPEPKRQRIDDASLIPAEQFLAHHPGPASISVSVPNLDEGNLRGQVLQIPVQSLSDTIGSLKEHIAGELQLPANKQKLSLRTSFLKDNLTLAYYNVGPGVVVLLTLKERGGRRKSVFPISV